MPPGQPVSYRYHNDWVSEALARFGIWLAKKRTHAFRKLCAQMATNRGMPLEVGSGLVSDLFCGLVLQGLLQWC